MMFKGEKVDLKALRWLVTKIFAGIVLILVCYGLLVTKIPSINFIKNNPSLVEAGFAILLIPTFVCIVTLILISWFDVRESFEKKARKQRVFFLFGIFSMSLLFAYGFVEVQDSKTLQLLPLCFSWFGILQMIHALIGYKDQLLLASGRRSRTYYGKDAKSHAIFIFIFGFIFFLSGILELLILLR